MNAGIVYLIQAEGTSRYKIGITKNLEKRYSTLSNASPFPLKIVYAKEFNNCREIESSLHKRYATKRVNLEWFEFESAQVEECIHVMSVGVSDSATDDIVIRCFYGCREHAPIGYIEFSKTCKCHSLSMYS